MTSTLVACAQYLRILAPSHLPRLIILCSIVLLWATMSCPISVLGQPHEQLIIFGGVVTGEILGYLSCRRLRLAHLRTRAEQSQPTNAAGGPSGSDHLAEGLAQLNPLSICFCDAALERQYMRYIGGWTHAEPKSVRRGRPLTHPPPPFEHTHALGACTRVVHQSRTYAARKPHASLFTRAGP